MNTSGQPMKLQKLSEQFSQVPSASVVREVLAVPAMTMVLACLYLAATFVRDVPLTLTERPYGLSLSICLVVLAVAAGIAARFWTKSTIFRAALVLSCVVNAGVWSGLAGADFVNFVNGWRHTGQTFSYLAQVQENHITHGKDGRVTLKIALQVPSADIPTVVTVQSSNVFTAQQYAQLSGSQVSVYLTTGRLGLPYISAFDADD